MEEPKWITGPTIPVPNGSEVKISAQVRANPGEGPVFESVKAVVIRPPRATKEYVGELARRLAPASRAMIQTNEEWNLRWMAEAEYDSWFPIAGLVER